MLTAVASSPLNPRRNPTRKRPHGWDVNVYKSRNLIERMFCRRKDYRRVAKPSGGTRMAGAWGGGNDRRPMQSYLKFVGSAPASWAMPSEI